MASDNQFVIPLDHDGEWYRYHHLFGEMLLTEMRARQPAVVHDVALRASSWFERHGEPETAVEHAFAARDERAAELIWRYSPLMLGESPHRHRSALARPIHPSRHRSDSRTRVGLGMSWMITSATWEHVHRMIAALEPKGDERLEDGTPISAMLGALPAR